MTGQGQDRSVNPDSNIAPPPAESLPPVEDLPGPARPLGWRTGPRLDGLWRNHDFVRFWAAERVSQLGSQVIALALPRGAALTLAATPFDVGLLAAVGTAPSLVVGLFAGAWVDRLRRRPILIVADLARAALLLTIPLAAVVERLAMSQLYGVALVVGTMNVLASAAYSSYLPTLVRREALVEGNSKLEVSGSTAQVAGPGAAGALIGAFGGAAAIVIDAASLLLSAALLSRIGGVEPAPASAPATERRVWSEIGEGLRAVARQPILRSLALSAATTEFFAHVFFAVYVLYFIRALGLTPAAIGLVFAIGGVGALVGALVAGPARRRLGQGPAIVWGQLLFGLSGLVIPLAALAPAIALEMVIASEFFQWLTIMGVNGNGMGLRQALTPDRMRGRVNATFRFLVGGSQPLGSLLGGVLGGLIGLQLTLVVGEIGMLLAIGWLLRSPLPRLREAPETADG